MTLTDRLCLTVAYFCGACLALTAVATLLIFAQLLTVLFPGVFP